MAAAAAPRPAGRPPGRAASESPRTAAGLVLKAGSALLAELSSLPSARDGPCRPALAGPHRAAVASGRHLGDASACDGSHRPARVGLHRAVASGRARNPVRMAKAAGAHRPTVPPAAGSSPPSQPRSGGRARPPRGVGAPGGGAAAAGAAGSQAADRGAVPLRPQRIELPSHLNTPARRPDGVPLSDLEQMAALRKIQDLELLALACRRASRGSDEGRAHFSLGVMRDNLGQYHKAIESYSQFLRVCTECADAQGCGLACHCIGVDYQLLAGGAVGGGGGLPDSPGRCHGSESGEMKAEMLRKAISFHNRHREGVDSVGKFVAHLNNGLAYALLGEKEHSTVSHQYALRYALELHSLEGQSLAIGSMGFSEGMYCHDPGKMSVLIERYMELCGALGQPRNQAPALQKLGSLAVQRGDLERGACCFRQAVQHAREQGDLETELDCSVQFGVAHGLARMDDHLGEIHDKLLGQRV